MDNGIMMAFKAEALLKDSDILTRIENLRKHVLYSSDGQLFSFDDYLTILRDAVDAIPKLELETDVAPGTENQYSIQLVTGMEQIVDDCDRVQRKLAHFQSKLRDAERQINNLKSEFLAWYVLQASALIANLEDIKLPSKEMRALGEAEFSRLMGNLDLKIETVLEDLKLEFERVAQHKSTQKEKHNLGKDQANASWTSALPSFGNSIPEDERTDKLNQPQAIDEIDEEGVPAFVSRKPKIADVKSDLPTSSDIQATLNKAKPGDTVVIRQVEDVASRISEIKDTPRIEIVETPKSPRRRLIIDDEEIL